MKKIKCLKDLRPLKKNLPAMYIHHIKQYFYQLHSALSDSNLVDKFQLGFPEGFIVILEKGDDVRNLSGVGLNGNANGLLDSWPEFVEKVELGPTSVYKVSLLLDNSCMMTLFTEMGIHDPEVEEWLAERAEEDRRWDHPPDSEVPF